MADTKNTLPTIQEGEEEEEKEPENTSAAEGEAADSSSNRIPSLKEKLEKLKQVKKEIKEVLKIEDILHGNVTYTQNADKDGYDFSVLVSIIEILVKDLIIYLRLLNKKYEEKFGEMKRTRIESVKANLQNITGVNRIPFLSSAFDFANKRASGIKGTIYDITRDHKYDTWKATTISDMQELQKEYTKKGGNKKRTRKMNKKSKANKSRKH